MSVVQSLKAQVVKFLARKDVQSVLRHAAVAAGAVLLPVLFSGTPLSLALVVAAGAAAIRVISLAVQAKLQPVK